MSADWLLLLLDATSHVLTLLLVALGLAITFGLMRVINLAHGELVLLGAYTLLAVERAGGSFWVGFVVAPLVVGALGLLLERVIVRRVQDRPLDTLLATWGVAIALRQGIVLLFGPGAHTIEAPFTLALTVAGTPYPAYRLFVMGVALGAILATVWLLFGTRVGLMVRGTMADRTLAAVTGLSVPRLDAWTFAYGSALAGLAGAVVAPLVAIDPQLGVGYLLPAFLAVLVIGGGLVGTAGGALLVGGGESFLASLLSPVLAQLIVLALAVVLLRRTAGRRGERQR